MKEELIAVKAITPGMFDLTPEEAATLTQEELNDLGDRLYDALYAEAFWPTVEEVTALWRAERSPVVA